MSGDVDLQGAAALLCRSYSWFQKHWRTHRHPASGAPIPQPFVGAGRGERPWWRRADLEAWKAGATCAAVQAEAGGGSTQRTQAPVADNDPAARPPTDRVSRLRAGAGG